MNRQTAGFDQLLRFWLDTASARGVVARLDRSLAQALEQHDYPSAVAQQLRHLAGAAVALASNLKQAAKIVLQAQGDGTVPLLCVEATEALTLRAYASVREGASVAADTDLADLVAPQGNGRLTLTIAPEHGQMYQGIVTLRAGPVAELLGDYLCMSQQTATRLWLRDDGNVLEALMLERLPEAQQDESGDRAWSALVAQADTAFAEPFMPFPFPVWLNDVFAGHVVRGQEPRAIRFACSCTLERVHNALRLLGADELQSLLVERGEVDTRCEFCGKRYRVDAAGVRALFAPADATRAPGSDSVQ
ncbi:MAG: Hsp33 family molecular chaperone HslO [Burkholderiales bacterium]|nr:Hsp33 family molecular chaperone HslO [Burkholderiales bacterium]